MKIKQLKGFSFLEILITISVILVLVVSSVIVIPRQITKAKDAKIKANLYDIYMGLEDYYDSQNNFPETIAACNQPLEKDGHIYMPNIPCDPFDNSNYLYTSGSDNSGKWFKLYAKLRNTKDISIVLAGCSKGCGPNCEYNYGVSTPNTIIDRCVTSTPAPPQYACSPGNNICSQYDDPVLSQCPKVYLNDPTCKNECSIKENRCKNNSGKNKPE